jgi:glutamate 5-kinase
MASRKRWLALAVRPAGQLVVDHGAATALRESGKSLLPVGVAQVKGPFARGDVVRVVDPKGELVGQGLINYSSRELQRIKGLHTDQAAGKLHRKRADEVIHRDNLALAPKRD